MIVMVATAVLVMLVQGVGEWVLCVPGLLFEIVVFTGLVVDTFLPTVVLIRLLGLVVTMRQLPLVARVVVMMRVPLVMVGFRAMLMMIFFVGQQVFWLWMNINFYVLVFHIGGVMWFLMTIVTRFLVINNLLVVVARLFPVPSTGRLFFIAVPVVISVMPLLMAVMVAMVSDMSLFSVMNVLMTMWVVWVRDGVWPAHLPVI